MTITLTKYTDYSPFVPGLIITDVTYSAAAHRTYVDYQTEHYSDCADISGDVSAQDIRGIVHAYADKCYDGPDISVPVPPDSLWR
jgi:hypothetical protein